MLVGNGLAIVQMHACSSAIDAGNPSRQPQVDVVLGIKGGGTQ